MTRPASSVRSALLGLAALALPGCSRDDVYSEASFTENVAQAYAECSDAEIKFLAGKHNLQLAFDECGSNKFAEVDWSPDGRLLFFQLTHGGHVLNAEDKTIEAVPTETPSGGAVWVKDGLLAVPLPPADEDPASPWRIAWYDRTGRTLDLQNLPLREPKDVQPFGEDDDLLLTAIGDDGARRPFRFIRNTGKVERALDQLTRPVARVSFVPEADLIGWSDGENGQVLRISDGAVLAELPDAHRVVPHHEGRYVAIETLGAPISLFDQRTWNELSPEARERELRRKEQWLENLPEWAPREAEPPEIHVVDLTTLERYRITAFYGDHFEWWRPRNYWCSFVMWGIEGKQLHRNVALTDLHERLRMASKGELPWGLERVEGGDAAAAAPRSGTDPSGPLSIETAPAGDVSK